MSSRERKCEGCKIGYNIIESYVSLNFQLQILHLTWLFYDLEKSITLSENIFRLTWNFCLDISRLYQNR